MSTTKQPSTSTGPKPSASNQGLVIGLSIAGVLLIVVLVLVILGVAKVLPFGKAPAPPPATAKITGLPWNAYLTCDSLCNSPKSVIALQQASNVGSEMNPLPPSFLRNNKGARSDGNSNYWANSDSSCTCIADNQTPWESLPKEQAIVTPAYIPAGDDTSKYEKDGTCDPYCHNAIAKSFAGTAGWQSTGGTAAPGSPLVSTARLLNNYPTCTCVPSLDPDHAFPSS